MRTLQIKTALQIRRPAGEVFEAMVDPAKMSGYFIAEGSARMEAGKEVQWRFPEFDGWSPVHVLEVVPNELIAYEWEGSDGGRLRVDIRLETRTDDSTLVRITEGSMPDTDAGVRWLQGNTEGWANFLACLKAYLEYGINLRKGAFEFMKDQ